jgi:hypothetical protein
MREAGRRQTLAKYDPTDLSSLLTRQIAACDRWQRGERTTEETCDELNRREPLPDPATACGQFVQPARVPQLPSHDAPHRSRHPLIFRHDSPHVPLWFWSISSRRCVGSLNSQRRRLDWQPISVLAITLVERRFVAALDRDGTVVRGASPDRIACEPGRYRGIVPIDNIDPLSRNQYFFAPGPPVLRIDYQVTDCPSNIVEDETADVTNASVGGLDVIAPDCLRTTQMS